MITASAILFEGKVYTGKRHHNVIRTIVDETGCKRVGTGSVQGFVTDTGEFLDREAGAIHALACGQITKLKFNSRQLFSEDLW